VRVARTRGWWCRGGEAGRAGCRAADRAVRRGERTTNRGVRSGGCGGVKGPWGWRGGGGENAAGLPVAAPTAAAAAPAAAPPAAIGLLLATNLATMDEVAKAAWHVPRGADGMRGSGGEGGRRCEAGGLGGVRRSASRA